MRELKLAKFAKILQRLSASKRTAVFAIALGVWTFWLTILGVQQAIFYLTNHWEIALTMVFGSMVAGGTSVGGGAVAFPVFTKLLEIPPPEAKMFSLAIQSVGMTAASLAICLTGIKVEWRAIFWASLGGIVGIFLGLDFVAPVLPPDVIKMCFTTMLASLAVTLLIDTKNERQYHSTIYYWGFREQGIFLCTGLLGGLMSSLVGSGIDIIAFSVMVLLFRINEKISTPTSVILMALNSLVGFGLQVFVFNNFQQPVISYWLAAIPVVVVGAPLGAMLCSLLRRQTIANIVIGLIAIEAITSLIAIPLRPVVIYLSLITLILFSALNYWMCSTKTYAVQPVSVKNN